MPKQTDNTVTMEEALALMCKKSAFAIMDQIWQQYGLPVPEKEYRFCGGRKWRIDYAWPAVKLALEIEGIGGTLQGRHQRIGGFQADMEKYNALAEAGWRLLRYPANSRKIDFWQIRATYERTAG